VSKKNNETTKKGPLGALAGLLATAVPATVAGWIFYSNNFIDRDMPLPDAIRAEREQFYSQTAGWLNYYHDTHAEGRPLLLIHSINAAPSAYEVGPLFDYFRARRPVYALDLPGYGFSHRDDIKYRPQLFEDAISDMIALEIGEPVDIVAMSLGSEFAARAAITLSRYIRSISLISPTGFGRPGSDRATQRANASNVSNIAHSILSLPLWARPIFDLLTTRRTINYYLQQSFVGEVTPGFVEYAYVTAHQPGAHHAPLHFLSGRLFTQNARTIVYENVRVPTLVIYDEDPNVSFDALPGHVEKCDNWQATRITPSRGLPHFEKTGETAEALQAFWQSLEE
jgi:pimeloyl-ACP methyl ester carboxylesterase